MRAVLVACLLTLLVACGESPRSGQSWQGTVDTLDGRVIVENPPVDTWSDVPRGRLVEELRIGSVAGDGPDMFGQISGIAVSRDGDIAVLDGQAHEVRIFDHSGLHLRTLGRAGAGPGEFEAPLAVHYDGTDRLWVVDGSHQRYKLFDREGEFVRGSRGAAGMVIGDPGVYTGRGLLDPVPHVTPAGGLERLYILVDTAGEVADTLPPVDLGPVARLRGLPVSLAPFIRRTISTADPGGDVWLASTDRYMLYRRTPSGDTAMAIRMEVPAAQLGPDQRDSIDAGIRGASRAVAPDEAGLGPQAIRALHPNDGGRLFVEPAVGEWR